jgi:HAD superfamily hydrolase (TIGR01509 family)
MILKAVLWDVDGTLVETERDGHRVAFNRAFVSCGLPWHWSKARYGELQAIYSERERLLRDMAGRPDAPRSASRRDALARRVRDAKIELYPDLLRHARLPLRDGVMSLMQECREQGVRMVIATTTSRACVEALLQFHLGAGWRGWFDALVCGEDVQCRKPDPEVYVRALLRARVCPAHAVAIEDSPVGASAARAVDMPVVLARSSYFVNALFPRVAAIGPGLDQRAGWQPNVSSDAAGPAGIRLADIDRWVAQARRAPA